MIHAKQRAYDRYQVVLTDADFDGLVAQIVMKKSLCTKKLFDSEIHAVSFEGKAMIAVFVPQNKTIVTFLPPGSVISRPGLRIRHMVKERLAGHCEAIRHTDGVALKKNYRKNKSRTNRQEREQRQLAATLVTDDED